MLLDTMQAQASAWPCLPWASQYQPG